MRSPRSLVSLIAKLQDPDQIVRIQAATQIGSLGDEGDLAVPALIDMLENGGIQDRRLAALTLGEIGPAAEDALESLLEAAEEEDEVLGGIALEAIERIDPDDEVEEAA